MGKNLGDDLREGKVTLPLIAAMQHGNDAQRQVLRAAIESDHLTDLGPVLEIIRSTGALDLSHQAAIAEAQRAIAAARKLPANAYSEGLLQLAAQLLERRS
jgi:octaprenyl-diphosphate synthase